MELSLDPLSRESEWLILSPTTVPKMSPATLSNEHLFVSVVSDATRCLRGLGCLRGFRRLVSEVSGVSGVLGVSDVSGVSGLGSRLSLRSRVSQRSEASHRYWMYQRSEV